jgi:hypothetical protein
MVILQIMIIDMVFSEGVETLNIRTRKSADRPLELHERYIRDGVWVYGAIPPNRESALAVQASNALADHFSG